MASSFDRIIRRLTADRKFSEILTGSVFALGGRLAATGLALAASIITARFYGAEALGVLAVVNSFLMLATIFTVFGSGTSILVLIPEYTAKHSISSAFGVYRKTQYLVVAVSVVSTTILFLSSRVLADKIFSKPHLASIFALSSLFVVFKSAADLNIQAVRGLKLIKTFAFMQVLPSLVMFMTLAVLTLFSHYSDGPVYAQLVAFAITALVGALIMDRTFKRRMQPSDKRETTSVKNIFTISLPMLMTASLQFFIAQTGVIMLGIYCPEKEVGYFFVAVKLATLTSFILQAINSIAAPKFAELFHTGKIDELFYIAQKSTRLIFWTTVPILVTLFLFGKIILKVLFGKDFVVAYLSLVILVIGQFVNSVSGSTGYFMNMTGHQRALSNIIFVAAIINVALAFLMIPRFGINGAAVASIASLIFWNVSTLWYIKAKYGHTIGYIPLVMSK